MTTVTTLKDLEFWPATKSHPAGQIAAYITCSGEPFILPKGTRCVTLIEGPCTRWLAKAESHEAFRILSRDEYKDAA